MHSLQRHALAIALAATSLGSAYATEAASPHWSYRGGTGPNQWSHMAQDNQVCGTGRSQSPIDVHAKSGKTAHEVALQYSESAGHPRNNGHTVQVDVDGHDLLTLDGTDYQLAQFHFHTPSEHHLSGRSFPMEVHLVHKSANGQLAVVGVFIREGKASAALAPLFAKLPADGSPAADLSINPETLLPAQRKAYGYEGSLTTPPCTEHVKWVVMQKPIEMSHQQIRAFGKLFGDNHRPVQKSNGRKIESDAVKG